MRGYKRNYLYVRKREWGGNWELENWKYGNLEKENGKYKKYELGIYQENWKYGSLENRKWGNIKKIGIKESLKNMVLEI